MRALLPRSNAETLLYMELHPCQSCGEIEFNPGHSAFFDDGWMHTRYSGPCPRCGTAREFLFRLPEDEPFPDDEEPSFGDERPSTLVDAGEWVWLADLIAASIPAAIDEVPAERRGQARFDLRTAAAAVSEALKFVPDAADAVPATALWSDRGRRVYDEEPARFTRSRLELAHRTYRDLADRFTG